MSDSTAEGYLGNSFFSHRVLYFEVCELAAHDFTVQRMSLEEANRRNDGGDAVKAAHLADMHAVTAIVFSAMCLEAMIWEYAVRYFSAAYVKRHLDKLDLPSKYVVVPRLVTGKEFDTDSQAFEDLVEVTRSRNDLVHYKAHPVPREAAELAKTIAAYEDSVEPAVRSAYAAPIRVSRHLATFHEDSDPAQIVLFGFDARTHRARDLRAWSGVGEPASYTLRSDSEW